MESSNILKSFNEFSEIENNSSISDDISIPSGNSKYKNDILFVKKELEEMCGCKLKIHWSDLGNSVSFWTFDENGGALITNVFGSFVTLKNLLNSFYIFRNGYNFAKKGVNNL